MAGVLPRHQHPLCVAGAYDPLLTQLRANGLYTFISGTSSPISS